MKAASFLRFPLSRHCGVFQAHLNVEFRHPRNLDAAARHLGRPQLGAVWEQLRRNCGNQGKWPIPDKEIEQTKQTLKCSKLSDLSSAGREHKRKGSRVSNVACLCWNFLAGTLDPGGGWST